MYAHTGMAWWERNFFFVPIVHSVCMHDYRITQQLFDWLMTVMTEVLRVTDLPHYMQPTTVGLRHKPIVPAGYPARSCRNMLAIESTYNMLITPRKPTHE